MTPEELKEHFLQQTEAHLDLVRSKPCAIYNCRATKIFAAHLEPVGMGNNRKKPSLRHYSAVPLCSPHHWEQEGNTPTFEAMYGISLWRYAQQLMVETLTGVEACWKNDR